MDTLDPQKSNKWKYFQKLIIINPFYYTIKNFKM